MQSDDPPFLPVGTEVSAKFKGAFCEAKVKKVTRSIKVKLALKEAPFGNIVVDETSIVKGDVTNSAIIDVVHGKQTLKAQIQHIKDCSTYHVVFNDGDEKVLRRTQMCLKGAKHFDAAVNLDALPLYNPEQFSSPVVKSVLSKDKKCKKRKSDESSPAKRKRKKGDDDDESDDEGSAKKREKRAAASAATVAIGEMDQGDTELSEETSGIDSADEKEKERGRRRDEDEKDKKEARKSGGTPASERAAEKEKDREKLKERKEKDADFNKLVMEPGKVVCAFEDGGLASKVRDGATISGGDTKPVLSTAAISVLTAYKWQPAIVVPAKVCLANRISRPPPGRREVGLRSIRNAKYFFTPAMNLIPFSYLIGLPKNTDTLSTLVRNSLEKAHAYAESETLPAGWNIKDIFGDDVASKKNGAVDKKEKDKEKEREKKDEKEKKEKDKEREKDNEKAKEKEKPKEKRKESSGSSSSSDISDAETGEERDMFIARLYKFHDDRGSPINKAPILGGKDIDLYHFYKIVQHYGGMKKVSARNKWRRVINRLSLDGCPGATTATVKNAYLRYLAPFSSIVKTLGWASQANEGTTREERKLLRAPVQNREAMINAKPAFKRRKSTAGELAKDVKVKEGTKEDSTAGSTDGSTTERKLKSESPFSTTASTDSRKQQDDKEAGRSPSIKPEEPADDEREASDASKEKKKGNESATSNVSKDGKREKEKGTSASEKREKEKKEESSDVEPESRRKKEKKRLSMRDRNERKSLSGTSADKEKTPNADEGYRQANILSHFYMGQKVSAKHTGSWYDARVLEVRQPVLGKLVVLVEKVTPGVDDMPQDVLDELAHAIISTEVFVHYLGWNSRYDEWISLDKIRICSKDTKSSVNMFYNHVNRVQWPEERIAVLDTWLEAQLQLHIPKSIGSPGTSGANDDPAYIASQRPRRLSASQAEHIHEGLKREQAPKMSTVSSLLASSSTTSGDSPSTSKVVFTSTAAQSTRTSLGAKHSLSSPMGSGPYQPLSPSVPRNPIPSSQLTMSTSSGPLSFESFQQFNSDVTVRDVAAAAVGLESRVRGSRSPLTFIRSPARVTIANTSSTIGIAHLTSDSTGSGPVVPGAVTASTLLKPMREQMSPTNSSASPADAATTGLRRNRTSSRGELFAPTTSQSSKTASDAVQHSTPSMNHAKESDKSVIAIDVSHLTDAFIETNRSEALVNVEEKVESATFIEPGTTPTQSASRKTTKKPGWSSAGARPTTPAATERKETRKRRNSYDDAEDERELELEEEARQLLSERPPFNDESDAGASGSDTPQRTDTEELENDKSHGGTPVPEERRSATHPARGTLRGVGKRKRGSFNRHSMMVVDRKYQRVKPKSDDKSKGNDDDSDGEEDENAVSRDTFNSMKTRMYKQMEHNNELNDLKLLDLPDYEKLLRNTPNDELSDALDNRALDLREIFLIAKAEIVSAEKLRRKYYEKKRERERAQRRSETPRSAANSTPISIPPPATEFGRATPTKTFDGAQTDPFFAIPLSTGSGPMAMEIVAEPTAAAMGKIDEDAFVESTAV